MFRSAKHTPTSTLAAQRRCTFVFDNEFGASVVRQPGTGNLYSLMVIDVDGDEVTNLTGGPQGTYNYLTPEQVDELLDLIAKH